MIRRQRLARYAVGDNRLGLFVDDNDTVDVYVHWQPDVLGCVRGWFD